MLWPEVGFTKGEMIDYYARIADAILPHIRARPMTLKRYPNGVDEAFFYEKQVPSHRPEWVASTSVYSRSNDRNIDYVLVQDLPTLTWLANLAALELHASLSRAGASLVPDSVVFDLDPGPPAGLLECCRVALLLRETLAHLGLECVAKTSGSKGMQLYVPLNTPCDYDRSKGFANALARLLERQHPQLVVSNMSKAVRPGKVFIDWSQNDDHKTTIAVYSLRAREQPMVSTPLHWHEVEAAGRSADAARALTFEAGRVLERVSRDGDIFAPLLTLQQALPTLG